MNLSSYKDDRKEGEGENKIPKWEKEGSYVVTFISTAS